MEETAATHGAGQLVPLMIRTLLTAKGLRGRDLCSVLGISEGQVSQRLNGHAKISVEELALIADFLHVEPGDLFQDPAEWVTLGRDIKSRCFPDTADQQELALNFDPPPADISAAADRPAAAAA